MFMYFVQKITRIRKDPDEQALPLPPDLPELDTEEAASSFATFSPVSVLDVERFDHQHLMHHVLSTQFLFGS